jgi:glucoamylase
VLGALALLVVALSGGERDDPRTPGGLPGLPPPFLGVTVVGSGGPTAAVDAYGDVVDLRVPGPAGRPLVSVSAKRQSAGTVPLDSVRIAKVRLGEGKTLPFWRADSIRQRYLPGTNVLRTVAWFGEEKRVVVRRTGGPGEGRADRHWLAKARPLGGSAPRWARAMYRRSLLVLRALTARRSGAVAAGARDGWAYVWPRDAAAVAMAFGSAGYRLEAQRIARFLRDLNLNAAARFRGTGEPVPGRTTQGDAAGWVAAAIRAAGLRDGGRTDSQWQWRERADYQEGDAGDYLGNAIASGVDPSQIHDLFESPPGLNRAAGDPDSGLDSTAAWAVRPFPQPSLFPAVRRTLLHLGAQREGRFGLVPSEEWHGGDDPWTAPTAWTAWALASLGNRHAALGLMDDLRRAATPLGLLPERVDARTGLPTSTTPLAWSHAFAILALRELWPGRSQ